MTEYPDEISPEEALVIYVEQVKKWYGTSIEEFENDFDYVIEDVDTAKLLHLDSLRRLAKR